MILCNYISVSSTCLSRDYEKAKALLACTVVALTASQTSLCNKKGTCTVALSTLFPPLCQTPSSYYYHRKSQSRQRQSCWGSMPALCFPPARATQLCRYVGGSGGGGNGARSPGGSRSEWVVSRFLQVATEDALWIGYLACADDKIST